MNFVKRYYGVFILFIFSLIILVPIFHAGSFPVHDDTQASRVFEMARSLKDGMFPVRWVRDLGFSYGYPIFNFYAPFPYYVGAIFVLLGFDALTAAKIMMGIAVVLAGLSMYFFVRQFLGQKAALGAGIIYLFFPYFAVNIFVRGAVSEYYAYALLPLVFLGFFKIYYTVKQGEGALFWVFETGIAMSLITISHNLTAYMVGLFLLPFAIVSIIIHRKRKKLVLMYILAGILAFMLSAFYTLPAIFEMHFTNVLSQTKGGFSYFDNFVCPGQLWNSPWGFGGSIPGCVDGLSFRLGKSNILFSLASIIFGLYIMMKKKKEKYTFFYWSNVALLLLALFMTLSYSQFIWKIVPGINFVQFPWRFLDFVGLAMSVLIGFLLDYSEKYIKIPGFTLGFLIFMFVGTLYLNAKLFVPQIYDTRTVSSYTSQKALTFTISKITNEYMPANFIRPSTYAQVPKKRVDIVQGAGTTKVLAYTSKDTKVRLLLTLPSEVRLNMAYFPSWQYTVDDKMFSYHVANDGIYFFLPPGKHILDARFVGTFIEYIADLISVIGIFILIAGIILQRKKRYAETS